jgi:hypothetical protein
MLNISDFLFLLSVKDMGHGLVLGLLFLVVLPKGWQFSALASLNILSKITFVLALSLAVGYLIFPNYFDHAEPTVATIGQIVQAGGLAYPSGDQWQFIGLIYGPGIYLSNSIAMLVGDPVLGSKLPGVLAYIASLLVLWYRLPSHISRSALVLIFFFYEFGFLNRPDSYLLLLSTLSVALVLKSPSWGLLCTGILAGIATTFKFTGFLFFIPVTVLLLIQGHSFRQLWVAIFAGLTVALAPYALSSFSLANHLAYVQSLATQTLSEGLFQRNLAYSLFSILPIAWLWTGVSKGTSLKNRYGVMILVMTVTEFLVCVLASKPGAGPHHLLPGLPLKLWLMHELTLAQEVKGHRSVRFLGLVLWSMSLYYIAYGYPKFLKNHFVSVEYLEGQYKAKIEFHSLLKKFPNSYVGVTDSKHANYSLSFFRPYAFASDYGDRLDPVAFMEVSFTTKIDDRLFVSKIETCSYSNIILASNGEPFTLLNFYTNKPLFSDELRSVFAREYRLIEKGSYFHVFECRKKTAHE